MQSSRELRAYDACAAGSNSGHFRKAAAAYVVGIIAGGIVATVAWGACVGGWPRRQGVVLGEQSKVELRRGRQTVTIEDTTYSMGDKAGPRETAKDASKVLAGGQDKGDFVGSAVGGRTGTTLEPVYFEVKRGRCADFGHSPIRDVRKCGIAAAALGYSDSKAALVTWAASAPEGCYVYQRELWLAPRKANVGNGAVRGRNQLCRAVAEPLVRRPTAPPTVTTTATRTTTVTTAVAAETAAVPPPTTPPWRLLPRAPAAEVPWTTPTPPLRLPAMTRLWASGNPSLLCYAVMQAGGAEEELIRAQFLEGVGVWTCDDTIIISSKVVLIGHAANGAKVYTWRNPAPSRTVGDLKKGQQTNSWLNTQVFINAVDSIMSDREKRIWQHDWFVKVDPDTVLFPERLRAHLRMFAPKASGPIFFTNCKRDGHLKLYGALEVFSKQAMGAYQAKVKTCKHLDWDGWGEDLYFQRCMAKLGARMVSDMTLVGDARCMYAPCSDDWRAAFHPFKTVPAWFKCWHESAGKPVRFMSR